MPADAHEDGADSPPSAADAGTYDAFLSYARKDLDDADRLCAELRGMRAIWVDREAIAPGTEWQERTADAIESCTALVFLLSPASASSPHCQNELRQADELNKLVVPVLLRPVAADGVPPLLARRTVIPMTDPRETAELLDRALGADEDWRRRHTRLGVRARAWHDHARRSQRDDEGRRTRLAGRGATLRDAVGRRGLLLRGKELAEAERWLGGCAGHDQQPTSEQREFVAAGRRAATLRGRVLAGTLVLLLALAVVAVLQRGAADDSRRSALAGKLAAEAIATKDDPALAAALAVQAARLASSDDVRRAVDAVLPRLGARIGTLRGHSDAVFRVAASRDGRTVATLSRDRTIRLWHVATRAPIGKPIPVRTTTPDAGNIAFSPDGRTLAYCSDDTTVRLVDVASRKLRGRPLKGHTGAILSLAFSPDGSRLATAGLDRTARLWSRGRDGTFAAGAIGRADQPIVALAFSADGRLLITGDAAGALAVRDGRANTPRGGATPATGSPFFGISVSADGARVAAADGSGTVRLWRIRRGRLVADGRALPTGQDATRGVAFAPTGRALVTSDNAGVRTWNATTHERGAQLRDFQDGSPAGLGGLGIAFAAGGAAVVTGGSDGTASLWNVAGGGAGAPLGFIGLPLTRDGFAATTLVLAGALTRDGRTLALTDHIAPLKVKGQPYRRFAAVDDALLVDVRTGEIRALVGRRHTQSLRDVAFSPDDATLATASEDGTVRLWDARTRRELVGPPLAAPGGGRVRAVAFSPDGRMLATAHADHEVRLWSVASHRMLRELTGHTGVVTDVVFSPDGKLVASASSDRTVRLWSARSGHRDGGPLRGHTDRVRALAFAPGGRVLVSASDDRTLRVWDVKARAALATLRGHTGSVRSLSFAPDGATLASGSVDRTVRLWDTGTWRPLGVPIDAEGPAFPVLFNADGTQLMAAITNYVRVWDRIVWSRDFGAKLRRLCASASRELSPAQWRDRAGTEPYRGGCGER